MTDFETYLRLGFEHIADFAAYDHILYICAVCAIFQPKEWKKVGLLITAFTIGHSLTLALSVTNILVLKSKYVEILIPITILITAIYNFWNVQNSVSWKNYFITLFFGFIHGMGFSYLLKTLLGKESDIFVPLLAFNLGIELGQIGIVGIFLLLSIITGFTGLTHNIWKKGVSFLIILMTLYMLWERL